MKNCTTQTNLKLNMSNTNFATSQTARVSKLNTNHNQQSNPFILQKTIEESIFMSLLGLADALNKKADVYCQTYGITMNQYLIMLYLAGDPNIEYLDTKPPNRPIVASELAEALHVSRPNISNLLNLLIEKKLVQQHKGSDDWRKKMLVLTTEGWTLLEKMQPARCRINRRLLAHLSESDKHVFLSSLQTCSDLLLNK